MAVEFFLTDGSRVCPLEFAAYESARRAHRELVYACLCHHPSSTAFVELDELGRRLALTVAELERVARAAFSRNQ